MRLEHGVVVATTLLLGAGAASPRRPSGARPATVIRVLMTRDRTGPRFEPSEIVARPGDTLRLVNGVGSHDLDFPADSNPRGVTLPAPTALAERPGDSTDLVVTLRPGSYFFQCDPHARLGMIGHLRVLPRRAGTGG